MEKTYPVLGQSMRFLLQPGDAVRVSGCAPGELRAGDVALFIRWAGGLPAGYVIHRVMLNFGLGGRRFMLSKGDANILPDWPPGSYQPAGLATAFEREGSLYPLPRGRRRALAQAVYSGIAAKAMHGAMIAASLLLKLARFLLPSQFGFLLNPACLAWESRAYPALLKLAIGAVAPRPFGAAPAGTVKSGRITGAETWSGEVTVADYLTIEEGGAVTVLPGTRVHFERREPWFFPVMRSGTNGEELQLESSGAKILVCGSLAVRGEPGREVVFSGPAFAGLHALGSGRLDLERAVLRTASGCALSARDTASASARGCAVFPGERGAEFYGYSLGALENCLFSGGAGPGAIAAGNSSLAVYNGGISAFSGPAVEARDDSCAAFSGFTAASCLSGFLVSGRARLLLDGCRVRAGAGRGMLAGEESRVAVARSEFSDSPGGVRIEGRALLEMRGSALSALAGPGLELSGRVSGSLSGCAFKGGKGASVDLLGPSACVFEGCVFSGGETGLSALGRAGLKLSGCSFSGTSGTALNLVRVRRAALDGCDIAGCAAGLSAADCGGLSLGGVTFSSNMGPALSVSGRGELSLSRSVFSRNAAGAEFSGEVCADISACRFEGEAGRALFFSGRSRAIVRESSFSSCRSALGAAGCAEVLSEACSFEGNAGPSFELRESASLRAAACRSRGAAAALLVSGRAAADVSVSDLASDPGPCVSLSGGRLSASSSALSSSRDAVYASGDSRLFLGGCSVASSDGAALNLSLREAALRSVSLEGRGGIKVSGPVLLAGEGVRISASDYAIDACGARLRFTGLTAAGGVRGGVRISGGSARLLGAELSGSPHPGLAASGAALKAENVHFNGRPWASPAGGAGPRLRTVLFHFAAATARLPGFSAVYRLAYLFAARAAGALLRPGPGGSVYLYRGMAAPGWVPGLSDMDLALLAPAQPAEEAWRTFLSLERRLNLFRRVFPFTGEVLYSAAPQFSAFLRAWGIKGEEFSSASRLLGGAKAQAPAVGASALADATEAFYSYTLLLGHLFSRSLPAAFRARNCAKGFIDVRRYLDTASPLRASRQLYGAAAGLDADSPLPPEDAAYGAFCALHAAAPPAPPGKPAPAGCGPWFNAHAFEKACGALSAEAGSPVGVALDSLYRVYLVLPDEAAASRRIFDGACAAFLRLRSSAPWFSATPLLLTRSAFSRLCALPYLNNPAFAKDLACARAGATPEDGGVFCCGIDVPAPAGQGEAREAAALAARHFCASWRGLWRAMPAHYFYTRAAGLRLLLAGKGEHPFSDPYLLEKALAAAWPGSTGWEGFRRAGGGRSAFEFVLRQTDAIQESLNA